MVTTMDIGSKWTWQGGQGQSCHADWPHMGTTLAPAMPSIRGSCSRSILKRPFNVGLINDEIGRPWIHGLIVIPLEPPTDLQIDFLPKFRHVLS
jgi:hypothetical protein